jgi:hypothetical protein
MVGRVNSGDVQYNKHLNLSAALFCQKLWSMSGTDAGVSTLVSQFARE